MYNLRLYQLQSPALFRQLDYYITFIIACQGFFQNFFKKFSSFPCRPLIRRLIYHTTFFPVCQQLILIFLSFVNFNYIKPGKTLPYTALLPHQTPINVYAILKAIGITIAIATQIQIIFFVLSVNFILIFLPFFFFLPAQTPKKLLEHAP